MSCFKLQESISAAQRRLPDAAMARPHQGVEFEFAAARIFRRRANIGLTAATCPWSTTSIGTISTLTRKELMLSAA
jgi:hypothetical protein